MAIGNTTLTALGTELFYSASMRFYFADDARQRTPSRQGMQSLVAAGVVEVPEPSVASLEARIDELCTAAGFPANEEFKGSPGAELWMRTNLVGDSRRDFFSRVLAAAHDSGARATVVIEDIAYGRATGNCSAETDVTRMLLERAHLTIPDGHFGMLIADRPGGGRGDEDRFIALCLETLRSGTNVLRNLNRLALAITTPSKFVRLLQLADLVTGCTTALVAGERRHAPDVFAHVRPLLRSELGRIGGAGVKIHPDFRYVNLYHWLFGDEYYVRLNVGNPLPIRSRPFAASPDVFR